MCISSKSFFCPFFGPSARCELPSRLPKAAQSTGSPGTAKLIYLSSYLTQSQIGLRLEGPSRPTSSNPPPWAGWPPTRSPSRFSRMPHASSTEGLHGTAARLLSLVKSLHKNSRLKTNICTFEMRAFKRSCCLWDSQTTHPELSTTILKHKVPNAGESHRTFSKQNCLLLPCHQIQ